ncbi:MAG: OmpA family protein [Bacteroidota bacterium]
MKTPFVHSCILIALASITGFSCVSPRVVEDLKLKNERCEVDNVTLKAENEKLTIKSTEMSSEIEDLKSLITALERDTTIMGTSLQKMIKNYNQINELYELLLQKNKELLAGNVTQTTKLMSKLQMTEEDLQKREDELKALERDLDRKKTNLEELKDELKMREQKVNDLQKLIEEKDAAVNKLKDKVSSALFGFKDKGITVEQKNGKVYVSLEAQLLFATGSTQIDPKGKTALIELANVLEKEDDLNVMVEGHTDTDKYKGGGPIKDNWELSVLRSIAVVRILTENSEIDPKRIISAGRGEYVPVDPADTEEAKIKNRRIEIILTPELSELYKILESN